jgi:hypothetical protein
MSQVQILSPQAGQLTRHDTALGVSMIGRKPRSVALRPYSAKGEARAEHSSTCASPGLSSIPTSPDRLGCALKRKASRPSRSWRPSKRRFTSEPAGAIAVREYRANYAGLLIDPGLLPTSLSRSACEAMRDGVIAPAEWQLLSARDCFTHIGERHIDAFASWVFFLATASRIFPWRTSAGNTTARRSKHRCRRRLIDRRRHVIS